MENLVKRDLTIDQFAEYLGVSRPTVYHQIKNGSIRAYKFGNSTRIPFDELDRIREGSWLDDGVPAHG